MDINHKAREFASYVKNTKEFKAMNKSKADLDKNRSLKKKLDSYVNKKIVYTLTIEWKMLL
ncbi:YlbF family regulator [[Clostridium] dakarense]|uniref:YlbF family regulator n=1 Tax=Faecalimicrobium dakarense TaxID=1301100 RepID=UPI0004B7CE4B|nr:YlbF family regulator [[Clostridium] dakarense]